MSDAVLAYAALPGAGGLGHFAANVLSSLNPLCPQLRVYGLPPIGNSAAPDIHVTRPPADVVPAWRRHYTWWRYMTGRYQYAVDTRLGGWLAAELTKNPFERGYFFTQIACESLVLARRQGARTILDNPTGHIRGFREALSRESERWTGWRHFGHPSQAMVERVEKEYHLADRIRVASVWAKRQLVARGVDEGKVFVAGPAVDLKTFTPPVDRDAARGPLRIVFVGSFSLGKGFQYLLRAVARTGAGRLRLEMVGATGDVWSHRLLDDLKAGLDVVHAPGHPLPAYQRGELFVFPSVSDGFGLVVAEAMACGLPVITTDCCGASEWVEPGQSGWVVPAGDEDALASALDQAIARRTDLADMGRVARQTAECLSDDSSASRLRRAIIEAWGRDCQCMSPPSGGSTATCT
jgi:glycosyltransferase involved in cell wall biosynthesis